MIDRIEALAPELRAWLVDDMDMMLHPIHANGNALCHIGGGGWHMLITMTDGGGLPEPNDWLVCVYPPDDPDEALWSASSCDRPRPFTLQQAVAAGCSIMSRGESRTVADEALEQHGYRICTYEGFMSGAVDFHGLDGCQHMSPAEIREHHDQVREALRERAAAYEGSHVVYDPNDNEDGWLLVGAEEEIRSATEKMIANS